MITAALKDEKNKARTGVEGLDDILGGGLQRGRVYLIEGSPGTGKTTIATQFLLAGAEAGERGLYITLSETEDELRESARLPWLDLDEPIDIFELVPPESLLDEEQQQSLLYSSDLELGETTKRIFEAIERAKPTRRGRQPVGNPAAGAELAALPAPDPGPEALFRAQRRDRAHARRPDRDTHDKTVHSVAHGVIRLEELAPDYGAERRRLRVIKYRGQSFRGGYHDFDHQDRRRERLPAACRGRAPAAIRARHAVTSKSPELDALLGGGIERGSSTLILGPGGHRQVAARR